MFLWIVLILIALRAAFTEWLDALNRSHVAANRGTIPEAFRDWMDAETYEKSADYTLAKSRFGSCEHIFDVIILCIVLTSGLLPFLFNTFTDWLGTGIWAQAMTLILVGMVLGLPSIPWEWAAQFRLEERFGFNKSTQKLWITDKIKGAVLGLLLGAPLIAAVLFFFDALPQTWWLWAAGCLFLFQLLMLVLYPMLIVPWFNKLSPLPEGDLRERLMALGERAGFLCQTIQVIDGSKRSGHSNAYFTGFGKFRRIVIYDTLIEQLNVEELEAVLAHEIGHYKCGHIPKMIAVAAVSLFGGFYVLHTLIGQAWFFKTFGFESGSMAVALLLFSLLSGLVTFWFSPLMHRLSRKHEFEADAFAKRAVGSAAPLKAALRKLHAKNLSNLTPHPWYSAFYYSHPTLVEREKALGG